MTFPKVTPGLEKGKYYLYSYFHGSCTPDTHTHTHTRTHTHTQTHTHTHTQIDWLISDRSKTFSCRCTVTFTRPHTQLSKIRVQTVSVSDIKVLFTNTCTFRCKRAAGDRTLTSLCAAEQGWDQQLLVLLWLWSPSQVALLVHVFHIWLLLEIPSVNCLQNYFLHSCDFLGRYEYYFLVHKNIVCHLCSILRYNNKNLL